MRELEVAFNKGRDELARALVAFPDSLPISRETQPIQTENPIDVQQFVADLKEFAMDDRSGSPAKDVDMGKDAANLNIQKEIER